MRRLRTKLVLAIAALGVVAAVGSSASAQQVCINLHLEVSGQAPIIVDECLPE